MRYLIFLVTLPLSGAVTLQSIETTPTQAVIRYNVPGAAACKIEIAKSNRYIPLVYDVDSTKFSGSNFDSRAGGVTNGNNRIFVAGTRAAQKGADNLWYSRALAQNTLYYLRINGDSACDPGGPVTSTFQTAIMPMGGTFSEGIPAGDGHVLSAWGQFQGRSNTPVVDPQTGLEIYQVTKPGDNVAYSPTAQPFGAPYAPGGTWELTGGNLPARFSAANSAKLFLPLGPLASNSNDYANNSVSFLGAFLAHLNLWCSGGTCRAASSANKTFNFCLGFSNGVCRSGTNRVVMPATNTAIGAGGTHPGLTDWSSLATLTAAIQFDQHLLKSRSGTFSAEGSVITSTGGDSFAPQEWGAGIPFTLTGAGCVPAVSLLDPRNSDKTYVIGAAPVCASGTWTVPGIGLILWKDTASTDAFTLGPSNFDYTLDFEAQWDSSPMQSFSTDCAAPLVKGGYICTMAGLANYLIDTDAMTATYLAPWPIPATAGINPPGTVPGAGGFSFDPRTPGVLYAGTQGFNGETAVYKLAYSGDYSQAPLSATLPTCTGRNQPCVTATLIEGHLYQKLRVFSPKFAQWTCGTLAVEGGNADGTLLIQLNSCPPFAQNNMGWYAVYDPTGALNRGTPGFIAARSSYDNYSTAWRGIHSVQLRRGNLVGVGGSGSVIAGGAASPLTGTDPEPGAGPYQVHVPGGIAAATVKCPARPDHSPIPAALWPGGVRNQGTTCKQITVAAEPCDPTPAVYTYNVTVTGGTAVAFSGPVYPGMVGTAITIAGNRRTLTALVDGTSMTIDVAVANGSYTAATVQMEALNGSGHCENAAYHYKRDAAPGDVFFVGHPTPHVLPCTGGKAGYETFHIVEALCTGRNPSSEPFLLLSRSGLTWTVQCGYTKFPCNTWPADTYLYVDDPLTDFTVDDGNSGFDSLWNYITNPTGVALNDLIDFNSFHGHGSTDDSASQGYDSIAASCPWAPKDWTGATVYQCYNARFGLNGAYLDATPVQQALNAPFHYSGDPTYNTMGIGLFPHIDLHTNHPYWNPPQYYLDAHPLDNGYSKGSGTLLGGTLYKFTAAQRGCVSGAACRKLDKILPIAGYCGHRAMQVVGGPGAIIGAGPADNYKIFPVYAAGEGFAGTAVGDVVTNCPGASIAEDAGTAQNAVGVTVFYNGMIVHGIRQGAHWIYGPNGESSRNLGHGLAQYHWLDIFQSPRGTPDNQAVLWRTIGVDGFKTQALMAKLPPIVTDNINRSDYVKIPVTLPRNPGGQPRARIRFGYAENGPVGSFFCKERQETCVTDTVIDPWAYIASDAPANPVDCRGAGGCTLHIPAIAGRVLYFAVDYLNSRGALVKTGPMNVVTVP